MRAHLAFLDDYSLVDHLYWQIPATDDAGPFELRREHTGAGHRWFLFRKGDSWGTPMTQADLVAAIDEHPVDRSQLETLLTTNILSQAVFANQILESAEELFSRETLDQSIADAKVFLGRVADTAKQAKRAQLKVVDAPKDEKSL